MDELYDVQHTIAEKMFAPLNAAERRQLYELLHRLADETRKARMSGNGGGGHAPHEHGARWRHHDHDDATPTPHPPRERTVAAQQRRERAAAKRKAHRDEANTRTGDA